MTFSYLFDYVRAVDGRTICESKRMIQAVFSVRKPELLLLIK